MCWLLPDYSALCSLTLPLSLYEYTLLQLSPPLFLSPSIPLPLLKSPLLVPLYLFLFPPSLFLFILPLSSFDHCSFLFALSSFALSSFLSDHLPFSPAFFSWSLHPSLSLFSFLFLSLFSSFLSSLPFLSLFSSFLSSSALGLYVSLPLVTHSFLCHLIILLSSLQWLPLLKSWVALTCHIVARAKPIAFAVY